MSTRVRSFRLSEELDLRVEAARGEVDFGAFVREALEEALGGFEPPRAIDPEWLGSAEIVDRFWSKVDRAGDDECWVWTAATRNGYGLFTPRSGSSVSAHRFAWELRVGPIPDGLVIDHLCRNRGCVNAAHLEPVTSGENVLRGVGITAELARREFCLRGHPLSGDNLLKTKDGSRQCRACKRERRIRAERASGAGQARQAVPASSGRRPGRDSSREPASEGHAEGTVQAESSGSDAPVMFRCRSCEFQARSPRAKCPWHPGKLVAS